jgi:hypothetical protein
MRFVRIPNQSCEEERSALLKIQRHLEELYPETPVLLAGISAPSDAT